MTIQQIVDSIFAAIIATESGHPLVVWALNWVKTQVDNWLTAHPLVKNSTTGVKPADCK